MGGGGGWIGPLSLEDWIWRLFFRVWPLDTYRTGKAAVRQLRAKVHRAVGLGGGHK